MSEKESRDDRQINIDIAGINNVSGQVNIAGGHIVHAGEGSTVIIGAEAVSGLFALRDLMGRSNHVRSAVITFQTDFKVSHDQIDRLADYKDLHDLLHDLQLYCYNGIVQAAVRFPDELEIDNVTDYALTLAGIAEELKKLATRPSMSKQEMRWMDDINQANADLRNAIDVLDEKLLKRVIWRLNRILTTQPSRINILLNHSARALRLPTLLNTLALVCETLAALDLDPEKVNAFQAGVDALGKIDEELSSLVEEHDRWQALDVELRRIEVSINRDLLEFEMSWPDVKLIAEPLYVVSADDWANALKREGSVLDDALSMSNPAKVRRSFRSYHRLVTDQFFRVDKNLKGLCGDIRKIGMPLASLLEMMQ